MVDEREVARLGLDALRAGLVPYVERVMTAQVGADWRSQSTAIQPGSPDTKAFLDVLLEHWDSVFRVKLGPFERSLVFELRMWRNRWAHEQPFDFDDAYRALDSAERLLDAIGADDQIDVLQRLKAQHLRTHSSLAQAQGLPTLPVSAQPINPRATRPPVRVMLREVIDAHGGHSSVSELVRGVLERYPGTNLRTVQAHVTICTVNNQSRVHFPQNQRTRVAEDERYDFLFRTSRGEVSRHDPARDGSWQIIQGSPGEFLVERVRPLPLGPDGPIEGRHDEGARYSALNAEGGVTSNRQDRIRLIVDDRVSALCREFPHLVERFEKAGPFNASQLSWHHRAIERRREMTSIEATVRDTDFLRFLWNTLEAWGMNARAARLADRRDFQRAVLGHTTAFVRLQELKIGTLGVSAPQIANDLWTLIDAIPVTESKNPIVGGTKALHHLLPDLVPPMDRTYTQVFFHWDVMQFQQKPRIVFSDMFCYFARIAAVVEPEKYVGPGWRTSATKVLDNAVVAFCGEHRASL